MRWFNISLDAFYSKPLSIGAHSLLKTAYQETQKHLFSRSVPKDKLRVLTGFEESSFARYADELVQKSYFRDKKDRFHVTLSGRLRCGRGAERLTSPKIPRGPGNMA